MVTHDARDRDAHYEAREPVEEPGSVSRVFHRGRRQHDEPVDCVRAHGRDHVRGRAGEDVVGRSLRVAERADDRVASGDRALHGLGALSVAEDQRDAVIELAGLGLLRTSALTSWPAASACVTSSRPTLPVAPRTASFTSAPALRTLAFRLRSAASLHRRRRYCHAAASSGIAAATQLHDRPGVRGSESAVRGRRMAVAPCTLSSWLAQELCKPGTFPVVNERSVMSKSDKSMETLADRAKEGAARVQASTNNTKEKLESQVSEARAAADKTRRELDAKSAAARDEGSQRWTEIRQKWDDHIAEIQSKVDTQKQEFNADRAEDRAAWAEDDAARGDRLRVSRDRGRRVGRSRRCIRTRRSERAGGGSRLTLAERPGGAPLRRAVPRPASARPCVPRKGHCRRPR